MWLGRCGHPQGSFRHFQVMRFSCDVADLRGAFTTAKRALPTKPVLSAYAGMLIVVTDDGVQLTASDGAVTVTANVAATDRTAGTVLLPPGPLDAFTSTVPGDTTLTFDLTDETVVVSGDGVPTYQFRPLPVSYPSQPTLDVRRWRCDLSALPTALKALKPALGADDAVQVTSAAGGDGVPDGGLVTMSATDKFRLSHVAFPGVSFGRFEGVVPFEALEHIARLDVTHVATDDTGGLLCADARSASVTTELLDVPTRDLTPILTQQSAFVVEMDRNQMAHRLQRLGAVGKQVPLRLHIDQGQIELSASSVDVGEGAEQLNCVSVGQVEATEFSCLVNRSYFLDAVKAQTADRLQIGWTDPLKPLHVTSSHSGADVLCVVSPMRG